jgi:hypothetical protein
MYQKLAENAEDLNNKASAAIDKGSAPEIIVSPYFPIMQ